MRIEAVKRSVLVASVAAAMCTSCGLAKAQLTYDIIDVGDRKNGVGTSQPYGMNDLGQVVGEAQDAAGINRAFRWEPTTGVMTLLSALPGQTNTYAVSILPSAINNSGAIAAYAPYYEGATFKAYHAGRWATPASVVDLSPTGGIASNAWSINESGVVGGSLNSAIGFPQPRLWHPDGSVTAIPLNADERIGSVQAVADDGTALVQVDMANPPYAKCFVRLPDGARVDVPLPAGNPRTFATAMNNHRTVVGYYYVGSSPRAFIWTPEGGTRDLPKGPYVDTAATAINDAGAIVGYCKSPSITYLAASIWDNSAANPVLLSTRVAPTSSTWGIQAGDGPYEINESGWILILGNTPPKPQRYAHAAVMTPTNPCPIFSDHPENITFNRCTSRIFLGAAAGAKQAISYEWRLNGNVVNNGQYFATRITGATTPTLMMDNPSPAWTGTWKCVAVNACGTVESNPATVKFCRADLDCDTFLTFEDFDAYVNEFSNGTLLGDYNDDGFITFEDFDEFVSAFESGC